MKDGRFKQGDRVVYTPGLAEARVLRTDFEEAEPRYWIRLGRGRHYREILVQGSDLKKATWSTPNSKGKFLQIHDTRTTPATTDREPLFGRLRGGRGPVLQDHPSCKCVCRRAVVCPVHPVGRDAPRMPPFLGWERQYGSSTLFPYDHRADLADLEIADVKARRRQAAREAADSRPKPFRRVTIAKATAEEVSEAERLIVLRELLRKRK
jgi:hypothetical protein